MAAELNLGDRVGGLGEPETRLGLMSCVFQVTSGPGHPDGGQGCDSGTAEQHSASCDCPNRPDLRTPQPLKPLAVRAGGTGQQQAEEPGSFSDGLSIGDFLPVGPGAEQSVQTGTVPLLEAALQTISSDLPASAPGEAPAAASTQPSKPQEYDFSTVLRPAVAASPSPGPVQAAECSLGGSGPQLWEDTCGKLDACVSALQVALPPSHPPRCAALEEGSSQHTEQLFGHVSGGAVPTRGYNSGIAPTQPRWNTHGHMSDASIRVGEQMSDVAPTRPRWNIHGHVSDASIRVGENVSDVAPTRPRWNIHGHVSDASIRVGENVSDVAPTRPRWNIHGHVSDASLRVGENVSDVAPTRPRWNIHGHVSDASISLGVCVSDVATTWPRWNSHGPIPPPHVTLGALSPETEPHTPRSQQSLPGHVSQSAVSLGAQNAALDCGPRLLAEVGPSLSSPSLGCGEESVSVGENLSDVAPSWPQWNIGGHVTDDTISMGENMSDVAATRPCWPNTPGDSISEEPGPGRNGDTEELSPNWPLNSQEDAAAQSSPGPGEEAVEAWDREQTYLAGQYHLEQYPDSYESMCECSVAAAGAEPEPEPWAGRFLAHSPSPTAEPPIAHLLRPMFPRAFAFPVDPEVQSAADETAVQLSELLTLPVLMKRSITAPLAAHISLVNKAAVDYFFVELHLEAHYEALRHFLLMEDGEFAQSLSDLLFEKLGAGQTPGELLNPLVLNSVLSKALQCSLHGDTPHASNLSLALKYLPEVFAPNAPDVLSCLELRYKVSSSPGHGDGAGACPRMPAEWGLLAGGLAPQCRHHRGLPEQVQRRLLLPAAAEAHDGYIANQILHVTWCEFRARLATVGDLEEIQRAHAEYLHKAVFRGLLTEKAAPVMNIIHSIFSLVLKFRSQLISQAWVPAGGPRGAEHPNFALMQQSYNTFKYYSHFLFKVVTKLVNRGYQPHLEDFLLRINFNNYYQDA
ncbi:Gamma-tubulin complex component 6 [Saguinus oedipus]|uniref:Gamma-tubulin complex component n=1 Tax=Saguinus oedipus TaxID=9490 RepID=A0ABQ9WJT3_SAGOE|nr:Gamma-tubulin complex component 6 [Saguinus oedipus]